MSAYADERERERARLDEQQARANAATRSVALFMLFVTLAILGGSILYAVLTSK